MTRLPAPVSAIVVLVFAGCAGEPVARPALRMPQVTLPPPAAPVAAMPTAREVLAAALEQINRGETTAAVRLLTTLPSAERIGVLRELFVTVAQLDPMRTGQVAAGFPPGALRSVALDLAAQAMIARDPDGAVRWVMALKEDALRFDASRAVADRLVEREPRAALDRLLALPATRERDDLLALTAARWSGRDAAPAVAWVRGLPDGDLKTRATTSVGFELAQSVPERAVELAEMLPPGRNRWLLLTAIAKTWVARDSAAAMAWSKTLPAGEARTAAIAGLDAGLGVYPPRGQALAAVGAADIALRPPVLEPEPASLPPGPERERALRRRFDELMLVSPALAANYVGMLPLPDRSQGMMNRLAREWLPNDPAAAKVWLEQNVPVPAEREILLREAGLWPRPP